MRKGLFLAGVVILVLGALMVLGGYAYASQPSTVSIAPGSVEVLTPGGLGSTHVDVSWSGGTASTQVFLTANQPACPGTASSAVASGTGASGSFSGTLSSGTTYGLYACPATGSSLSVTTTATGFTYLMLIGVIVLIVGLVLALLGYRAAAKVRVEESMEDETPSAPDAPYAMPETLGPGSNTATTMASSASEKTVIGDRIPPPTPPQFMPASADPEPGESTGPAAAPGAKVRPSRTCAYCGTVNESWITNCRKCKRPLASTGT